MKNKTNHWAEALKKKQEEAKSDFHKMNQVSFVDALYLLVKTMKQKKTFPKQNKPKEE